MRYKNIDRIKRTIGVTETRMIITGCMYVCMYVCVCVCTFVVTNIPIYIYIHIYISISV